MIVDGPDERHSPSYRGLDAVAAPFDWPLPDPPENAEELAFEQRPLSEVRALVSRHAGNAGLSPARSADLVLAVNEMATNSLQHGGGHGLLRVWEDGESVICEICDDGHIADPLAGRQRLSKERDNGRGLWIANQSASSSRSDPSPPATWCGSTCAALPLASRERVDDLRPGAGEAVLTEGCWTPTVEPGPV